MYLKRGAKFEREIKCCKSRKAVKSIYFFPFLDYSYSNVNLGDYFISVYLLCSNDPVLEHLYVLFLQYYGSSKSFINYEHIYLR